MGTASSVVLQMSLDVVPNATIIFCSKLAIDPLASVWRVVQMSSCSVLFQLFRKLKKFATIFKCAFVSGRIEIWLDLS